MMMMMINTEPWMGLLTTAAGLRSDQNILIRSKLSVCSSSLMMMMVVGGARFERLERSSLLIHSPGLNSLNQRQELILTFRRQTQNIIGVRKRAPLILHPVRLQSERQTFRQTGRQTHCYMLLLATELHAYPQTRGQIGLAVHDFVSRVASTLSDVWLKR